MVRIWTCFAPSGEKSPADMTPLLVPEVGILNLPLLWLVSFFRPVIMVYARPFCFKSLLKRLTPIDQYAYIEPGEAQVLKDRAYERWTEIEKNIKAEDWAFSLEGRSVDLSMRFKQTLGLLHERYYIINHMARRMPNSPRILDTFFFSVLRNYGALDDFDWHPSTSSLSFLVRCLDQISLAAAEILRSLKLLGQLSRAVIKRSAPLPSDKIKILWDAVIYYEMTLDKQKRSFAWILDEKHVPANSVLFLLPHLPSAALRAEIKRQGIHAHTPSELYGMMPLGVLFNVIWRQTRAFLFRGFGAFFLWRQAMQLAFTCEILRYEPFRTGFDFKVYMESSSQMGHEKAHVPFWSSMGIRTFYYAFSANSYHWTKSRDSDCDFKSAVFSNIQVDELLGWHDNYVEFLKDHVQPKALIHTVGPLMPGVEKVMEEDKWELRRKQGLPITKGATYISFYDVAPVRHPHLMADLYPTYYTDAYMAAFLNDMIRLHEDFPEAILIYKPKRPISNLRFSYSKVDEVVGLLSSSKRGFIFHEDINPWVPLAVSDICVSVAFTSVVFANAHYGRAGLFHDPLGSAINHRYHALDRYISHGFEDLREKLKQSLAGFDQNQMDPVWRGFVGPTPGKNSTDQFRSIISKYAFP